MDIHPAAPKQRERKNAKRTENEHIFLLKTKTIRENEPIFAERSS